MLPVNRLALVNFRYPGVVYDPRVNFHTLVWQAFVKRETDGPEATRAMFETFLQAR